MKFLGKWQLKAMEYIEIENDAPKKVIKTREQFLESEDSEERMMGTAIYEFTEDGQLIHKIPLPEGMSMDELSDEEKEALGPDGLFTVESKEWKEEDGKILINSEEFREICGEEQSPWDEVVENADGTILYKAAFPMTLERLK